MTMLTAQKIYDLILKEKRQSISNRLQNKFVRLLFNIYKKTNPLVEAKVGNFVIKLPFSHELPFILKSFPYYSTNLARIAKLVEQKYPDLTLIDVGANVGDSVALLRTEASFPILCIEGDKKFYDILQINSQSFTNIYLSNNYVGDLETQVNAISVEIGGTAHISQNDVTTIHMKTISSLIEGNLIFYKSKMIKVDTDGFDNKIIEGSIDVLKRNKPVIFFEYDPHFLAKQGDYGISIFDLFLEEGYQNLLVYENNGELLVSANLENKVFFEDITYFYSGRNGQRYCDICVFHEEDTDLFNAVRKSELQFFANARKS